MYKILVFDRGFSQIPHLSRAMLPCPRAFVLASARRFTPLSGLCSVAHARRTGPCRFQNPVWVSRIWLKIPLQKPEFHLLILTVILQMIGYANILLPMTTKNLSPKNWSWQILINLKMCPWHFLIHNYVIILWSLLPIVVYNFDFTSIYNYFQI